MCGRIGLKDPPRDVGKWLDARVSDELEATWEARYNVGPTDPILGAQVDRDGDRVLHQYRWGLIPSWAKDPKVGSRSFNARADSVATKPLFRNAFRQRRLLVPVSGFYEWQAVPDRKAKQPTGSLERTKSRSYSLVYGSGGAPLKAKRSTRPRSSQPMPAPTWSRYTTASPWCSSARPGNDGSTQLWMRTKSWKGCFVLGRPASCGIGQWARALEMCGTRVGN